MSLCFILVFKTIVTVGAFILLFLFMNAARDTLNSIVAKDEAEGDVL